MATPKKPVTPVVNNTGATITNCHIENKAAPCSPEAAAALLELAKASGEHAKAMAAMANALKGSDAHMGTGIYLADVKGS